VKSELIRYLSAGRIEAVADLAASRKRVLSWLTGLTYHPDPRVADRAVQAFGLAAARIAAYDPEYVRVHLRRLLWLVSDESGGIGWRAPELVASALAACPDQFDEFISPLVYLLDLEPEDAPRVRPSLLAGLAHLAACRPQTLRFARPLLRMALADPNPSVRAQAQTCLERIG